MIELRLRSRVIDLLSPVAGVALVLWIARRYDHPALPDWLRR